MSLTINPTNHFLNSNPTKSQVQIQTQRRNSSFLQHTNPRSYSDSNPDSTSSSSQSSSSNTESSLYSTQLISSTRKSFYTPQKRRIELYPDSDPDTDIDEDDGEHGSQEGCQCTQGTLAKKHGSLEFPINLTLDQEEEEDIHHRQNDQIKVEKKRKRRSKKERIILPSLSPSPSPSFASDYFDGPNSYETLDYSQDDQEGNWHMGTDLHHGEEYNADPATGYQSQDELLIMEDDEEQNSDEQQDDLLLMQGTHEHSFAEFGDHHRFLTPIKPVISFTHPHHNISTDQITTQHKASEDDEAIKFAKLMQRYEGKREYEILAEGGKEGQNQVQGENTVLGKSQTSTNSGKSQEDVENFVDRDEERRNKTLAFLGSIVTSFLSQLHTSQLILESQKALRSAKRNPRKKQKKVEEEAEDQSQELLIYEKEEEDEPVEGEGEGSQGAAQTEVGVKLVLKNRKTGNDQIISFPDDPLSRMGGQTSIDKITCILRIVAVLYEAVCSQTVVTLRDIFYRDKALFRKQDVVDKLVDDLVATAGLKRKDFFVCASAKGLIAATSMKIIRRTGEEVFLSSTVATLIDPIERIAKLESTDQVDWVLVVEKDAVFQTLCSARLLEDDRLGSGVMITGKGFPDLATRQILHLIAETYPQARIYALVDADPHGLSILSTYTFGSQNTRFSHDHAELPLGDRIEWLGLRATDFKKLGIGYDDLLPLEKADIQLAMKMLKNPILPKEWKRELSQMLHINRKAEIEIILESKCEFDQHEPEHDLLDVDDLPHIQHGIGLSGNQEYSKRKEKRKSKLVEYIVERILH